MGLLALPALAPACRQRLGDVFPGGVPRTPLEKKLLPIFQGLEDCFEEALSYSPERFQKLEELDRAWKEVRQDPSLDFSVLPAKDDIPKILEDLDRTFARIQRAKEAQDFSEGYRQAVLLQHMVTELYEVYPPKSLGFGPPYQTLKTILDLPPLEVEPDPRGSELLATHRSRLELLIRRWNRWAKVVDPKVHLLIRFQDLEDSIRRMDQDLKALEELPAGSESLSMNSRVRIQALLAQDYRQALAQTVDLADPLLGEALKVKWFLKLMQKEGKVKDRERVDL